MWEARGLAMLGALFLEIFIRFRYITVNLCKKCFMCFFFCYGTRHFLENYQIHATKL